MDSRAIRVKTLNTVFDQFVRDDLEHAQGEWTLDRVKILTSMLKMKLESRAEDIDQSMVVSSNEEDKAEDSVLDEIRLPELKAGNPAEIISSLSKLAIAVNKLNKFVTSLKEIASNSPKKTEKPPQNITVNIVPQTPLKNQPIVPSLTPRRRTPFKENGQEVDDPFMQELFNHPSVTGFLDHLTLDLIGNLMDDDGSSSHASTPIDTGDSDFNSTLTAMNTSGGSLTTPKEVFRKPPIERLTPSTSTAQGTNPVKNLMHELRTPEKSGRGDMSSPFSSPFVPCSSPCPEPVGESPVKIVMPDFNALTASPIPTSTMLSAAPRPVFIVQQSVPQQQKMNQQFNVHQSQQNQIHYINSSIVHHPIINATHQVVSDPCSLGRKIAPKLPAPSGIKVISPIKAQRAGRKSLTTKKVNPNELAEAIKETRVKNKRKAMPSSNGELKRFVKLSATGTNSSPDSHRLVIDEGKIVQQMSVQSTTVIPVTSSSVLASGQTTILSSSLINPSTSNPQNKDVNVNDLCNNETMDILKGLPKNSQKLDELLLSRVHNKSGKK